MLLGMWDPTSLTRNGTCTPALEAWSLNHWPTGKVPSAFLGPDLVKEQKCSETHLCRSRSALTGPRVVKNNQYSSRLVSKLVCIWRFGGS